VEELSQELMDVKAKCLGSFIFFTKTFFRIRTGREFKISQPMGRESHHIQIARELTSIFWRPAVIIPSSLIDEAYNLNINIFPRSGKTELLISFVAWALAHYPDSNFIYASYSHFLATKATQTIREIISLPHYRKLFGVALSDSSSAKDNFTTASGGTVFAAGTGGTITGFGAGIKGVTDRFGGCFILDDSLKPDEATSDTIRQGVIDWWYNTAQSRLNNGNRTSVIHIGQRVHEADLPALFISMPEWRHLILPSLDSAGNALDPDMYSREELLRIKEQEPYVFAAQHQQDPQPAGGGIFKEEWFPLLDEDPKILTTFITADTAETEKTYNDPTVFEFWGLYKIVQFGNETDIYGLHLIDCVQLWVEPKDLQNEFMAFYTECMRYGIKPKIAAIEKKSTGSTLCSVMKGMQGLQIIEIERSKVSGSKADRFLAIQSYAATKRVSLPRNGRHTKMVLEHMRKITASMTHRYDDICDALADAVKLALVDKVIGFTFRNQEEKVEQSKMVQQIIYNQQNTFKNRHKQLWG
jgi:predicted phage terminase large subunit-like protein